MFVYMVFFFTVSSHFHAGHAFQFLFFFLFFVWSFCCFVQPNAVQSKQEKRNNTFFDRNIYNKSCVKDVDFINFFFSVIERKYLL